MTILFKCDFCKKEVAHDHQLRKAGRTGSSIHPSFEELYPEMEDKDICNGCTDLPWKAREEFNDKFLDLYREYIDETLKSKPDVD